LIVCWPATPVRAAGPLSFAPAVNYGAGFNPYSVTTGDFNKDGKTDLVVANYYSSNVSILINTTPSSTKAITAFTIPGQAGTTTIDESAHTIALTMPYGTDVTALVPTITITGASASPASGVAHDFTAPSTYTVTAEDTSTQAYTVTVTTCSWAKPALSLSKENVFWASYADHLAGKLTVNWRITNTGSIPAYNVKVTSSTNSNGVTINEPLPIIFGIILEAGSGQDMKERGWTHNISTGVGSWHSTLTGSAQDACGTTYTYP